jgi:hypothetical protein
MKQRILQMSKHDLIVALKNKSFAAADARKLQKERVKKWILLSCIQQRLFILKSNYKLALEEKWLSNARKLLSLRLILRTRIFLNKNKQNRKFFSARYSTMFVGPTVLRTVQKRSALLIARYLVKRKTQWQFRQKLKETLKYVVMIQNNIRC